MDVIKLSVEATHTQVCHALGHNLRPDPLQMRLFLIALIMNDFRPERRAA
jgi:hypothetical protein